MSGISHAPFFHAFQNCCFSKSGGDQRKYNLLQPPEQFYVTSPGDALYIRFEDDIFIIHNSRGHKTPREIIHLPDNSLPFLEK